MGAAGEGWPAAGSGVLLLFCIAVANMRDRNGTVGDSKSLETLSRNRPQPLCLDFEKPNRWRAFLIESSLMESGCLLFRQHHS